MGTLRLCTRNALFLLRPRYRFCRLNHVAITGNPQVDKAVDTITGGKIGSWLRAYEDLVGLTEVREAQSKVIQAEQMFLEVQKKRRQKQAEMSEIHAKLKEIHVQLDKVQRGEERYLSLLTEEYQIIREEKAVERDLIQFESQERDLFAALSSAVRESHEKERARTERTKYWSVFGSIIGAFLGILGTSINNYLKMREIKGIVKDSAASGVELKGLLKDLSETVDTQNQQINAFVSDMRTLTGSDKGETKVVLPVAVPSASSDKLTAGQLELQIKQILNAVKEQSDALSKEMFDLKRISASSAAADKDGNIVYVGPEVQELLEKTQSNIEWKIKTSALWTVTFIYGALAVTLPVLYTIFKGS